MKKARLTITVAAKACEWCGQLYPATNKYKYCTPECSYEAGNHNKGEPIGREPLLLDDYDNVPSISSFQDITCEYTGKGALWDDDSRSDGEEL